MFHGKQIVLYVYDSLDVENLVEIILHEYSHYLQFQNKVQEKDYDKKHNELGYENNPYEIEARQIAKQKKKECLKWVLGEVRKNWSG